MAVLAVLGHGCYLCSTRCRLLTRKESFSAALTLVGCGVVQGMEGVLKRRAFRVGSIVWLDAVGWLRRAGMCACSWGVDVRGWSHGCWVDLHVWGDQGVGHCFDCAGCFLHARLPVANACVAIACSSCIPVLNCSFPVETKLGAGA
jgi:hypothetical protein